MTDMKLNVRIAHISILMFLLNRAKKNCGGMPLPCWQKRSVAVIASITVLAMTNNGRPVMKWTGRR